MKLTKAVINPYNQKQAYTDNEVLHSLYAYDNRVNEIYEFLVTEEEREYIKKYVKIITDNYIMCSEKTLPQYKAICLRITTQDYNEILEFRQV